MKGKRKRGRQAEEEQEEKEEEELEDKRAVKRGEQEGEEENLCPNGRSEKTTPPGRKVRGHGRAGQRLFGDDAPRTQTAGEPAGRSSCWNMRTHFSHVKGELFHVTVCILFYWHSVYS